jgi:hypothetical protein
MNKRAQLALESAPEVDQEASDCLLVPDLISSCVWLSQEHSYGGGLWLVRNKNYGLQKCAIKYSLLVHILVAILKGFPKPLLF